MQNPLFLHFLSHKKRTIAGRLAPPMMPLALAVPLLPSSVSAVPCIGNCASAAVLAICRIAAGNGHSPGVASRTGVSEINLIVFAISFPWNAICKGLPQIRQLNPFPNLRKSKFRKWSGILEKP
jgi:hypothetical protein